MRRGTSQYNDRATPVCFAAITRAGRLFFSAAAVVVEEVEEAAGEPEASSSLTLSNQTCCSVR